MILDHTHISQDGTKQRVAEMETTHLLNLIRYKLRWLEKVVQASESKQDKYTSKLYGLAEIDVEDAAYQVERTIAALTPYIFEAFFRGEEVIQNPRFGDIVELLQFVLKRDNRLIVPNGLQLPEKVQGEIIDARYEGDLFDEGEFPSEWDM